MYEHKTTKLLGRGSTQITTIYKNILLANNIAQVEPYFLFSRNTLALSNPQEIIMWSTTDKQSAGFIEPGPCFRPPSKHHDPSTRASARVHATSAPRAACRLGRSPGDATISDPPEPEAVEQPRVPRTVHARTPLSPGPGPRRPHLSWM